MVCYIHRLPGRVRVRSALIRRRPARADEIRGQLAAMPGVRSVRLNVAGASLIVHHDPDAHCGEAVLALFQTAGYLVPDTARRPAVSATALAAGAARIGGSFGKAVFDAALAKGVERTVRLLAAAPGRGRPTFPCLSWN